MLPCDVSDSPCSALGNHFVLCGLTDPHPLGSAPPCAAPLGTESVPR